MAANTAGSVVVTPNSRDRITRVISIAPASPIATPIAIISALVRGLWAHIIGRAVVLAGPAVPVQSDLEFLKTLVERGELRAVIGRTFSIDEIVDAHRHADTGHKVGNLVIVIAGAEP